MYLLMLYILIYIKYKLYIKKERSKSIKTIVNKGYRKKIVINFQWAITYT
jgi:hypothetical protein